MSWIYICSWTCFIAHSLILIGSLSLIIMKSIWHLPLRPGLVSVYLGLSWFLNSSLLKLICSAQLNLLKVKKFSAQPLFHSYFLIYICYSTLSLLSFSIAFHPNKIVDFRLYLHIWLFHHFRHSLYLFTTTSWCGYMQFYYSFWNWFRD